MTYQINLRLTEQEFLALRSVSERELRNPKDQIRYILRVALGLSEQPLLQIDHAKKTQQSAI